MSRPAILCDFDGTISTRDVLDSFFATYGDETVEELEKKFRAGVIDDRRTLTEKFARVHVSEEEFSRFIKREVKLDPYFAAFYREVKRRDLDFAVVSGGFSNYIDLLFDRDGIAVDDPVYSNHLVFHGNQVHPVFLHTEEEVADCHQPFGPCGNCKWQIYNRYRSQPVIYIGDGMTDRCSAGDVALLLAKEGRSLAEYCQKEEIPHRVFSDFGEVQDILFSDCELISSFQAG